MKLYGKDIYTDIWEFQQFRTTPEISLTDFHSFDKVLIISIDKDVFAQEDSVTFTTSSNVKSYR